MVMHMPHDIEYEVLVYCPRCGSKDVVLDVTNSYYHFDSCNKCGYQKGEDFGTVHTRR